VRKTRLDTVINWASAPPDIKVAPAETKGEAKIKEGINLILYTA
jgi:hypothetical protein